MTFSLLGRKLFKEDRQVRAISSVRVDVHAHLLPGLDNGPRSISSSVRMARAMVNAGFSKVIATPHIMQRYYPNSIEQICEARACLEKELKRLEIPLKLEAAAEYYLDEHLLNAARNNEPLLTMGAWGKSPYLLVETNVKEEPAALEQLIGHLARRGIRTILAHPEYNLYLQEDLERTIELFRQGLLYQVNWDSLHAGAKAPVRRFVQQLVDYRMVSFVGSNLHHEDEMDRIMEVASQPNFRLMTEIGLLNNELR